MPHTRGNHHEAPYPYPRERHGRRHPAGAQRRWAAKKAIFKVYVGVLYQQVSKGEQALNQAFSPLPPTEQKVLFYLPVTKAWLSAAQELGRLCQRLDNRAYAAINACNQLERKMHKAKRHHQGQHLSKALVQTRQRQMQAIIALADPVGTLAQWLQEDILALSRARGCYAPGAV